MEVRSRVMALQRETAVKDENSIDDGLGQGISSDNSDKDYLHLAKLRGSPASCKLLFFSSWISIIYFST